MTSEQPTPSPEVFWGGRQLYFSNTELRSTLNFGQRVPAESYSYAPGEPAKSPAFVKAHPFPGRQEEVILYYTFADRFGSLVVTPLLHDQKQRLPPWEQQNDTRMVAITLTSSAVANNIHAHAQYELTTGSLLNALIYDGLVLGSQKPPTSVIRIYNDNSVEGYTIDYHIPQEREKGKKPVVYQKRSPAGYAENFECECRLSDETALRIDQNLLKNTTCIDIYRPSSNTVDSFQIPQSISLLTGQKLHAQGNQWVQHDILAQFHRFRMKLNQS